LDNVPLHKSIVCEDDPYLLELTRYIHLNPLRVGVVKDLRELAAYRWTGHSVLMGKVKRDWQETDTVLSYFGRRKKGAIWGYESYVGEGISQGRRPELVGGVARGTPLNNSIDIGLAFMGGDVNQKHQNYFQYIRDDHKEGGRGKELNVLNKLSCRVGSGYRS